MHKKEKKKVLVATLMEICHLKNAESERKHQKHKGRVVLRGDLVKEDSGAYARQTQHQVLLTFVDEAIVIVGGDARDLDKRLTPYNLRCPTDCQARYIECQMATGQSAAKLRFRGARGRQPRDERRDSEGSVNEANITYGTLWHRRFTILMCLVREIAARVQIGLNPCFVRLRALTFSCEVRWQ